MIVLSANNLTKLYGVEPVLTGLSFHVNKGDRIGIVGANGAGKTTLLNILAKELKHDEGDFFVSEDTTFGYLKQKDQFESEKTVYEEMLAIFDEVIAMEKELARLSQEIADRSAEGVDVHRLLHRYDEMAEVFKDKNGYGYKSEIKGILNSMAFSEEFFNKEISLLSGGERTRLALAALLLKKPDILLLDEPTNHLDIGTLKWLEQYLKAYSGTIILISHDRYFLDQTVNRIFEIEHHKLVSYDGNYTLYVQKKRFREEDALKQYESQQKEIARQEEIIRRFKQHGTEKLAKRAQSREKHLDKIDRLDRPEARLGKMRIQFKEKFSSGNDVIFAKDLSKSFGFGQERRQLFSGVELDIKKGSRVCLVGPNGIGKTSLLKIIMGELQPDSGQIKAGHNVVFGYYDQEQKMLNGANTVLEELHNDYHLYAETELRSLLGRFLFRGEAVFKQVGMLSGGEKARLALLKLMLSGANVLVMDEPTNHLDIASKEVFEEALLDFPGTLLLVSHDRYFLNKVPTNIYELSENGITAYAGGYDYYLEKKQSIISGKSYLDELGKQALSSQNNIQEISLQSDKEKRQEQRRLAKEKETAKRRREKRLGELESVIASLEEEISELEEAMCKEEIFSDFEVSKQYNERCEEKKLQLEKNYEEWMLLNEEKGE
ncbi:MAG: ABC-F family ATP-binding cassette domain-containing protein [Anaerovorax sp.]|nr:ABC-F family ATP-binding cassette domain-containing protein [Anaerovorax sp.]